MAERSLEQRVALLEGRKRKPGKPEFAPDRKDGTLTEYLDDSLPETIGQRVKALIDKGFSEVIVRDDRGGSGAITVTYEKPVPARKQPQSHPWRRKMV